MSEYDIMFEQFKTMVNIEKSVLLSQLGVPAFTFPAFVVYRRNKLWLVLYFQEVCREKQLYSLLKAVSFFDDNLRLLWSTGLRLLPNVPEVVETFPETVDEMVRIYGEPHAEFGGGKSTFQYLADNGYIVFVQYEGEKIVNVNCGFLPDLEKVFNN